MSERLEVVLRMLAADRRSLSSVREPGNARRAHLADSLTGLEVPQLREAERICDLGAGAGFPGMVLADALPAARVDLLESVGRKCEFMREAARAAGFQNLRVIHARSEQWAAQPPPDGGREAYDCVTARAVARLATLAELASPLLATGGTLIAWKGRRDPGEEAELAATAAASAMRPGPILEVGERAGFEHRHLHVMSKRNSTPARLPRRPGMAKKRPLRG